MTPTAPDQRACIPTDSVRDGLALKVVLLGFHLVMSLLARYLASTYHVVLSPKLPGVSQEFAFRFNRRDNFYAAFQRMLGIRTSVEGPTYQNIYAEPDKWGGIVGISEPSADRAASRAGLRACAEAGEAVSRLRTGYQYEMVSI
jgi:hypothetical protein